MAEETIHIHHFQLRDKNRKVFLTNDDLYPDHDEVLGDQIVLCLQEEKAHALRSQYEQEFNGYGAEIEIEVVGFDVSGKEISIS